MASAQTTEKKIDRESEPDPNEYYKLRLMYVQNAKKEGKTVYPHKYHVSISLRDFIEKYGYLKNEEINQDSVSVA
ncbi:unnamed protein product, partial [Rotaria sp. Silwood1]